MKLRLGILFFLLSALCSSCRNAAPKSYKTGREIVDSLLTNGSNNAGIKAPDSLATYRQWKDRHIPTQARIDMLIEAAKAGNGKALEYLWNEVLYQPDSIIYANPQLALDIYRIAKATNPAMVIDNEACKLATIQKCVEAGPFDWNAFVKKYGIPPDTLQAMQLAIWEIAREASLGREFGKPDPCLVLQLVCRGGSELVDFDAAVELAYDNWKENKAVKFEPLDFSTEYGYEMMTYHYFGYIRKLEEDADARWRVKELIPRLKNNAGAHLWAAFNTAEMFFSARAGVEEGNGGSGMSEWESASITEQKNGYLDLVIGVNQGALPGNVGEDDSSDIKLDKIYQKVVTYLQQPQVAENMMVALSAEGVIETQRRWIGYRDSTAKMFAIINPATTERQWRNYLTTIRIEQLWEVLSMAKELHVEGQRLKLGIGR